MRSRNPSHPIEPYTCEPRSPHTPPPPRQTSSNPRWTIATSGYAGLKGTERFSVDIVHTVDSDDKAGASAYQDECSRGVPWQLGVEVSTRCVRESFVGRGLWPISDEERKACQNNPTTMQGPRFRRGTACDLHRSVCRLKSLANLVL